MSSQLPIAYLPLDGPTELFADGGASAHADSESAEAYELAVRLGASGVTGVVRRSADGVPVVSTKANFGGRFRSKDIASTDAAELPETILTLAQLLGIVGEPVQLGLRPVDAEAFEAVMDTVDSPERLWLTHPDLDVLSAWRERDESVRLVNEVRLSDLPDGPERLAAQLRERHIDAVSMGYRDWNAGMVALFHRFRRLTIGSDAQHERVLRELLATGIDGVISDHVDRMVDVAAQFGALHRA